jgi:hypothetical protein
MTDFGATIVTSISRRLDLVKANIEAVSEHQGASDLKAGAIA